MEKHDLLHEFPEHNERIHKLKMENNHFKKLFEEYDGLSHEIYRINTDVEPVSDEYSHDLKVKLLHLKDDIYAMLEEEYDFIALNKMLVTEKGKAFVRNICMTFDLRLLNDKPTTPVFSMVV